ncbi:DUF4167 domain-containing protein [Maritimibacter sp. HL-12]|jgi:hypothetical protein|uniref:DUF4167 domain-containing protein n=1 Tax=Maritimibacter sp. HL-12 TaxID=1162418 RepID=UPI000A0F3FFA|nr:DUF4167 domain-containing protein [Maritimibacter sp. HL-12]SMH57964.1 protein of unknown function [Maritimibacter sp. HL-12]
MRPSKSRSRGKARSNNRSPANNLNRVFDSSGPEGKVRGTPQQIIDKYSQLSRDAFLGNDRVAAENFQQHAEHYIRLLSEAQRDAEDKRQQLEQQNRDRQQQQQKQRERDDRGRDESEAKSQPDTDASDAEVIDSGSQTDSGLVETPEAKPRKPSRSRKPKAKPAPDADGGPADGSTGNARSDAPEAAE